MDEADNTRADVHRADAPGTLLSASRQAQNLSIADVARQLKLSLHQVEALEAGEYHRLPGPVFVRGFIRNYARLLKVDPEQLLQSAANHLPAVEPRPAAPPSQDIPFPTVVRRRWPIYAAAAAVVLLVALAVYEFYLNEPETASRSVAAPQPVPAAPVAPASATDAAESPPPAPNSAGEAGTAQAIQPPADSKGVLRDYETLPKPGERQVRMVFDQESWVEIRDRSGKAIFSQLNRRGTEQRVNGRPPLAVIVGNSHGVKLTWDERPVNLALHTKVDVARLTLE